MKQIVIILVVATLFGTTAIAENLQNNCKVNIKGLTEKQFKQMDELKEQHDKAMAGFRTEMRSTGGMMGKDKVRIKMLQQKQKHYKQIKEVLNEEQWKQFETIHQSPARHGHGNGKYAMNNCRNGRSGKGQNQRCGNRGNGNFNQRRGNGHGYQQGNGMRGRGIQRFQGNYRNARGHGYSMVDTCQYHMEKFNEIKL